MISNISVPVDAGCIVLADYDEVKPYLGDDGTRMGICRAEKGTSVQPGPVTIELDPGFYAVSCKLSHWNGNTDEHTRMHVPSGRLLVADLCHVVDPHKWQAFLEETDCLKKFPNPSRYHVINTGGDGSFHVNLKIKPLGVKEL